MILDYGWWLSYNVYIVVLSTYIVGIGKMPKRNSSKGKEYLRVRLSRVSSPLCFFLGLTSIVVSPLDPKILDIQAKLERICKIETKEKKIISSKTFLRIYRVLTQPSTSSE